MYLVIVNYNKDIERKRIDYLIEKWSKMGKIEKIKKTALIVDIDDMDEFIKEISSKLEGDEEKKLKIYKIEEVKKKIPKERKSLKYKINDMDFMEKFIDYLMAKMGGAYISSIGKTAKYEIYTKKGKGIIKITLESSYAIFEIEGYGEVVDYLSERINEEMSFIIKEG
ncbi:conserved hypothetical protein [Methanocaldococcus vulcanius M7]|uniref:Uncharacterized protein n=1 Tax=Methanocaldococcus vulcanius (strain ATCC 700851 / DSM 12094 / M7) TaxID=579137 RepID=C9RH01_METVM|nr:hypothetical protein [Methanocaldococcus vulcanius]ACX72853.1 conserved hypothetical protein [Methanocaldococcus vulcanius M7]